MIDKINKWTPILTLIAVVILAVSLVGGNNQSGLLGNSGTRFPNGISADTTSPIAGQIRGTYGAFTGTLTTGSSGTAVARQNVGTCYIRPYAATIAATSTAKVDCQATAAWNASGMSALAGVTAGDIVSVTLATSTAGTTLGGLNVTGASASTTAGYIELYINNLTGTTYTWPTTGTASGTATYIIADI